MSNPQWVSPYVWVGRQAWMRRTRIVALIVGAVIPRGGAGACSDRGPPLAVVSGDKRSTGPPADDAVAVSWCPPHAVAGRACGTSRYADEHGSAMTRNQLLIGGSRQGTYSCFGWASWQVNTRARLRQCGRCRPVARGHSALSKPRGVRLERGGAGSDWIPSSEVRSRSRTSEPQGLARTEPCRL